MRVLSGLSGFPTPTGRHTTSMLLMQNLQHCARTSKNLQLMFYYLLSGIAPGSPEAPCGEETHGHNSA